jgi:hypothetical protein
MNCFATAWPLHHDLKIVGYCLTATAFLKGVRWNFGGLREQFLHSSVINVVTVLLKVQQSFSSRCLAVPNRNFLDSDIRRSAAEGIMFDDYTINQLLNLRSLCADTIELADDVQKRADTLLLLEYIDEELGIRERKQSA